MYPPSIEKLIKQFGKFPTVGPRTAARFVFYLMKASDKEIKELTDSLNELRERIKLCDFCFKPFEGEGNLCEICSDKKRNQSLLCVIEKETDLDSIENTKKYKGRYFILGGTLSKMKKDGEKKLRIQELKERAKKEEIKEIIIATNPTAEGEATSLYLERQLKPLNKKITRLARGLPTGGELEYADQETLSSALEGRK